MAHHRDGVWGLLPCLCPAPRWIGRSTMSYTDNRTILQKADLALADLTAGGWLLKPAQSQRFMRLLTGTRRCCGWRPWFRWGRRTGQRSRSLTWKRS